MKKLIVFALAAALMLSAACAAPAEPSLTAPESGDVLSEALATPAPVSETPEPEPTPLPTPEPTPTPFGEIPDSAGADGILFDIYRQHAEADINLDSTAERISFSAGEESSTLDINGIEYTIEYGSLAQCFAVTDIDTTDSILELCFTEQYRELADSEIAFSHLFWWNGTEVFDMGAVNNLKFDGAWRSGLHPADFFDGQGLVQYVKRTTELTDVWYTGHFLCEGDERKLEEDSYVTKPLYDPGELTLKTYLVLLNEIDSSYFEEDYYVMWDYASGSAFLPRDYTNEIVSFIPQQGEELEISRVYGKYWFKLRAGDGKAGWLKCKDGKIQGVWQVMRWDANDIFDGIVVAG